MKKQIIGIVCVAAMMSSCHIYKSYDRPETIDASGIYRDPVSPTDTLATTDTTNMETCLGKKFSAMPSCRRLLKRDWRTMWICRLPPFGWKKRKSC